MKRVILTLLAAGLMTGASADERIHDRKENQQKRIGEGVENGSLTPRETANLERKRAGSTGRSAMTAGRTAAT